MAERKTSAKKTVIAKPSEQVIEKVITPAEDKAVVKETKNTKEQEKKIFERASVPETRKIIDTQ